MKSEKLLCGLAIAAVLLLGVFSSKGPVIIWVPPLTGIVISPTNPVIVTGFNEAFSATGNFSGLLTNVITSTNGLVWSSSNPSVATIDTNGVATGLTGGTTTITATDGSISTNTTLTVRALVPAQTSFVLSTNYNVGLGPASVIAFTNVNGRLDLACANYNGNTVTVLTNNGNGIFTSNATFAVGANPLYMTAADVNGDAELDLIIPNSGDGTLSVLTNNGSGGFAAARSLGRYDVGTTVVAADVNGDGKLDLIYSGNANNVTVLTNDGSGGFVLASSPVLGSDTCAYSVAVFTNVNGQLNIVSANACTTNLSVLTNNGGGVFQYSRSITVGGTPSCVVAADVNGDGIKDLICTPEFGAVAVLTNDGAGGFVAEGQLSSGYFNGFDGYDNFLNQNNAIFVTTADVNGDGKLDIIAANYLANTLTIYTNNGNGGFGLVTNFPVGQKPHSVFVVDVNGDGKPDLICPNSGDNTISVILNTSIFPPPPVALTNLVVSPTNPVIVVGSNQQFSATGFFNDGTTNTLTTNLVWVSSNTNVASITTNGLVTGLLNGVTTITATAGNVSNSTTLTVNINITQQPTNQVLTVGGTAVFSVAVAGTGPYTYQWQLNGTNLPSVLTAANGIITTVAGNGSVGYSGDGVAATNTSLNNPTCVAVDSSGNFYIADDSNTRIRKVGTNGIITTVAGNGGQGYTGDGGAATNASLNYPYGVAVDGSENVYIVDNGNNCIRKVGTNGIITTVAGLTQPTGVAVDVMGNIFITDYGDQCILKLGTNGITTTVAGDVNQGNSYSGDGGLAINAGLNDPHGVAVDGYGNIYIADTGNNRIRKVGTNGIITTVAGLTQPTGVAVDGSGNVYIAGNQRIRKMGTNGIITTVAGNGGIGYSGDGGAATNSSLNYPYGVAVDGSGNVYIADTYNQRVREVSPSYQPTLVLSNISTNNLGNYSVVITDANGSITSSVVSLSFPLGPQDFTAFKNASGLQLQLVGSPGYLYVLQSAPNLIAPVNWLPIFTNPADVNSNWSFLVTNLTSAPSCYYRTFRQ